jgi:outer membrane protein OmpA-like peptidoglycan-associated protein
MTLGTCRLFVVASIAASIVLFVTSCSLLSKRQGEGGEASHAGQRAPVQRIAQMEFGRDAAFAVCTEPACPTVTRKSLAVAPDAATSIAPKPTVNSATSSTDVPQPVADRAATVPAVIPVAERHEVIVHFMSGSAALTPAGKAALTQSLAYARKANRIVISGRTDSIGADNPNQSLAIARAFAVRDYLRRREPTLPALMVIEARGRCCFIASNDTPEGRRQNRRVEIVFSVPERVAP